LLPLNTQRQSETTSFETYGKKDRSRSLVIINQPDFLDLLNCNMLVILNSTLCFTLGMMALLLKLSCFYASEVLTYKFKGNITHYFTLRFSTLSKASCCKRSLLIFVHNLFFYHRQFAKKSAPRAIGDYETEKQLQNYGDV